MELPETVMILFDPILFLSDTVRLTCFSINLMSIADRREKTPQGF
jgi:hypothetical protein